MSTSPESSASAGRRAIDRAEFRLPVDAAFLLQMDRNGLGGQPLEIKGDANPIGGRRAEIGVELHVSSLQICIRLVARL
jgi:hypothetical protein